MPQTSTQVSNKRIIIDSKIDFLARKLQYLIAIKKMYSLHILEWNIKIGSNPSFLLKK